jgi:sugar lactone lactonase YvrE
MKANSGWCCRNYAFVLSLSGALGVYAAADPEPLFISTPLTAEGAFTEGIEGPACDAQGNIYAVNFARQQTVGKVTPEGKGTVYLELPGKSVGNGIRFNRQGIMFIADYAGHNVLRVDLHTRAITVFAHEDRMNQPNDLALAPDGTIYASDPDWKMKPASFGELASMARPAGSRKRWAPRTESKSVPT